MGSNIFKLSIITSMLLMIFSCSIAQKNFQLSPTEFAKAISTDGVQLVDVRTPQEYEKEHIDQALNMDWQGDAFDEEIVTLDKEKPVYVYCRSGKRSADAAAHMRESGFLQVYELKGGMSAWEQELLKAPVKKEDEE